MENKEPSLSGYNELIQTPLHTNKALNMKQEKRLKNLTTKSQKAVDSGNVQNVIDSLTDKQRRFAEEYLVDLNATQAVIRAGYNTKWPNRIGFQLLENQAVRIAVDGLRAQRTKNSDVTKDFVLIGIQKAIKAAEDSNNHNAVLRGYELLARHLGMFVERTEISGPDGDAIKMEQKIKEDVQSFTSTITRLADRARANRGSE
jgi:phage terminase small subunit